MAGVKDEQESIGELLSQLARDARDAAKAEVDLAKVRATSMVTRYKGAAIFFGAAGVLALAGFIALLVGLILTLAPHVGPGIATLIVVGVVMLVAGALALVGRAHLRTERLA
jgi:hypothetical protein